MPILTVKVGAPKTAELTQAIAEMLLDMTSRILKKKPQVTSIAIEYVRPEEWYIGGKNLDALGKSTFTFDIKITDETNSKDEKAAYIREVFQGFQRLLGEVHEESYIYVQDVRATCYGYGGLTQEYRYQQAN